MKAIILAAGRGSRMLSLTNENPKCLIKYKGIPLIEHQINALKKSGIKDIGIVCGYLSEMLLKYGTKHFFNYNWSTTNMVYSLLSAREWLENEPCIISYSDIVYSSQSIIKLFSLNNDISITYDPNWLKLWSMRFNDPLSDAETFKLDNDGCILTIGDKPNSIDEIEGQYMGILKITPKGWEYITNYLKTIDDFKLATISMTQLLKKMTRHKIGAIPITEAWYEFDSESDLIKC